MVVVGVVVVGVLMSAVGATAQADANDRGDDTFVPPPDDIPGEVISDPAASVPKPPAGDDDVFVPPPDDVPGPVIQEPVSEIESGAEPTPEPADGTPSLRAVDGGGAAGGDVTATTRRRIDLSAPDPQPESTTSHDNPSPVDEGGEAPAAGVNTRFNPETGNDRAEMSNLRYDARVFTAADRGNLRSGEWLRTEGPTPTVYAQAHDFRPTSCCYRRSHTRRRRRGLA